jgi:hypothetical protein
MGCTEATPQNQCGRRSEASAKERSEEKGGAGQREDLGYFYKLTPQKTTFFL